MGETLFRFQTILGTCWWLANHKVILCGVTYQVTQVKFIIKFPIFFLPESPGFCLMLETDGADTFQVLVDDILDFLGFFQVD